MRSANPNFEQMRAAILQAMRTTDEPIALGWDILRKARAQSRAHLTEKEIFIAGAGFLFDALVHAFSDGKEPSPEDLVVATKVHNELMAFHEHFNRKLVK